MKFSNKNDINFTINNTQNLLNATQTNQFQYNNFNHEIEEERKKTEKILNTCQEYRIQSMNSFKETKIQESLEYLKKEFSILQRLKDYIEQKANYLKDYLPIIANLFSQNLKLKSHYYISLYSLTEKIFKYKPKDKAISTSEYINQYIIDNTFLTFNEVFQGDENDNLQNYLIKTYQKSLISNNKSLLLYGPKGCGKSISVLALAENENAKFIQIDNIEFFNIEKFSLVLSNICNANQPIILYFKNIEIFIPILNHINFIFDKLIKNNQVKNKIFIVASSSLKPEKLPKELTNLFVYLYYVSPIISKYRIDYIKFLSEKFNIFLNITDENLKKLNVEYLYDYSNEDIKNLLLYKNNFNEPRNGIVLSYEDIIHGCRLIAKSISQQDILEFQ